MLLKPSFVFSAAGGKNVALTSNCQTDIFTVSNQHHLPLICGTMSGEHVYVEASNSCNDLTFTFGSTAQGVSEIASRSFSIKISQFTCDFTNLAPFGCDQYFYGSTSGYVQSFNYQNTKHLAAQSQDICIRYLCQFSAYF